MNILSYHVYSSFKNQWLGDDEKSWQKSFVESATFLNLDVANAIMEREGGDYVFACMGAA